MLLNIAQVEKAWKSFCCKHLESLCWGTDHFNSCLHASGANFKRVYSREKHKSAMQFWIRSSEINGIGMLQMYQMLSMHVQVSGAQWCWYILRWLILYNWLCTAIHLCWWPWGCSIISDPDIFSLASSVAASCSVVLTWCPKMLAFVCDMYVYIYIYITYISYIYIYAYMICIYTCVCMCVCYIT